MSRSRGRAISPKLCGVLGLALALAGLLAPASASALEHPFLENFGAANQPSFTEAEGLAVDQSTGDLLVIDAGNREPGEGTLSRWEENGAPAEFSALGSNVIEGLTFKFPEEVQVAVDKAELDAHKTELDAAQAKVKALTKAKDDAEKAIPNTMVMSELPARLSASTIGMALGSGLAEIVRIAAE